MSYFDLTKIYRKLHYAAYVLTGICILVAILLVYFAIFYFIFATLTWTIFASVSALILCVLIVRNDE